MRSLVFIALCAITNWAFPQNCDKLNLQEKYQITSKCAEQVMTLTFDLLERPYIYLANKEAGLTIHRLDDHGRTMRVAAVPTDSFDNLEVMGVSQYGKKLYLALGNFFTAKENPAMAIIDIDNPEAPFIRGFYKYPVATEGSSLVKVDGDYAYLTAFSHGLLILNISNEKNITLESRFTPVLNFPDVRPDATKINARGMVVQNNIVYLCYDAGGIRIINVSDKKNPKETGRYANPIMTGKPRAYNNAVLRDSLLYVAVDYCGLEILNVKDTANIKLEAWWNPWTCHTNPLNWFSSNGHTNEIVLDSAENKLFISTGKSDLHVVDVSDVQHPDSCSMFGGAGNNIGTWGVNRFKNKVGLAYICTVIPFTSNFSGVKILEYDRTLGYEVENQRLIRISKNPTTQSIQVLNVQPGTPFTLYDFQGRSFKSGRLDVHGEIDLTLAAPGYYMLHLEGYAPAKILKTL